ncbi:MAG: hypothetical protein GEU75_00345 [Dehalococcoidia bacterium]|nr:hypothetical protein [Dehalococcoidia bacterium]
MLNRVTVSLSLALLAVIATTGVASAATDQEKVAVGTFLLAVGIMAFLALIYFLKRALGLEKALPAEPDTGPNAHH